MRFVVLSASILFAVNSLGQTTGANGLNNPNTNTIHLGGTLLQNTNIDLGTNYEFNFLKGSNRYLTIHNNGNMEIGNPTGDDNANYIPYTWDTYNTRINRGNLSIFSTGNINTPGDSYQLSFYARYYNDAEGYTTNKAGYARGTVVNDNNLQPGWGSGRGKLVLGSTNTHYIPGNLHFTDVPAAYITNGKLGIGTAEPESQLHTTGTVRFAGLSNNNTYTRVLVEDVNGNLAYRDASTLGGSAGWSLGGNTVTAASTIGTTSSHDLFIVTNNENRMHIGANGNIGIGTNHINDQGYKLFVEGAIRTRKVRVDQAVWADYVFEPGYPLRPLQEVEKYIQQQKHLPEVPSAKEVIKEGIDLGDNQVVLLKKIEELTLYIIQQQKQLDAQQKRIERLEKKTVQEQHF